MSDQDNIRDMLGLGESSYVRLTDDEMTLLLTVMKIPRIIGYELPDDVKPDSLQGAINTLRARGGALQEADGTLVIEESLLNMVATGARWSRLITIALKYEGDLSETFWINMGRGKPVLHAIPEQGIHQFQTIPDGTSLLLTIAGLLQLRLSDDRVPDGDAFTVAPAFIDELDTIRAESGPEAVQQAVSEAGLPASFGLAATTPTINAAVAVTWPTTGEVDSAGHVDFTERLLWLWGAPAGGYWTLMIDREQGSVQVTPANGRQIISRISQFAAEDLKRE